MKSWKFFLLFALLIPCWVIAYHGVGDLPMYNAVAGYAHAGEMAKIYGDNPGVGHFFYAPLSLVFFSWMPFLSYGWVKFGWTAINTVAYLVFWWGLLKLYPVLLEKKNVLGFLLVWIVSIKPIHAGFQSHNVQIILAAVFVLAEIFSRKQKTSQQILAGMLPVMAGIVKVFPLFIAGYYFLFRSWWVRAGVVLGALVGLTLPFFYLGIQDTAILYRLFYQNLFSFHNFAPLTRDAVTLSLASLSATWLSPSLGMAKSLLINQVVSVILVVGFLYFVWSERKNSDARMKTHLWALGLALMALVNSSTRPDYFIFFVPAFASLTELATLARPSLALSRIIYSGLFVSLALIALISEWVLLGNRHLNHQLELLRLPVLGMILLCATLAYSLLKRVPLLAQRGLQNSPLACEVK